MNTQKFQVRDGQYTSDVFETIESARADAQRCIEDEGYSGCVEIVDAQTGKRVELVDCDEHGMR